jgi:hypothetical protein
MNSAYSLEEQYCVLHVVQQNCTLFGDRPKPIIVDGISDNNVSEYLQILTELGFVETLRLEDPTRTFYLPIRITSTGMDCLSETDKEFWQQAEAVAVGAVKHWLGIDVGEIVKFFKTAYKKAKKDKEI